jgi:predicted kinase
MLDRVLAAGEPDEGRLAALADLLCEFYASARAAPKSSKAGSVAALDAAVRLNFKTLGEYCDAPDLLDPIESAQLLFLARQQETFERRAALGKIRDVHADLRAEHVCLSDPPIVVGCTEARERERNLDVICDLASLLVDMETAGRGASAERLARAVSDSLEEDPDDPLWDFYRSFRALSSARRETLRPEQSEQVRRKCLAFVQYARERIERFYTPHMLVTVGLIGSGKSTLANALAGEFGLRRLSSEQVRDELFPDDPNAKSPRARLDLEQAERVYARLLEHAQKSLKIGASVVLDAGFYRAAFRERAVELARRVGAKPLFLDCRLSKTEAIARVDQRFRKHRTKSPPRPELYEEQVALFEPPDEIPSSSVVVLNLSQPVPDLIEAVRESL